MPKLEAYDRKLPYSYALGIFPATECLNACPQQCRRLLVHSQGEKSEGVQKLIARCEKQGVRVEIADRAIERVAHKENCFAAMVFDKFERPFDERALHVVLHHPSDSGNLGTILRAALGFGFTNIAIIRPAVDVFDPRVVRSSMGAMFSLHVRHFDDFQAYRAQESDRALFSFMLTGAVPPAQAVKRAGEKFALIFGNEASGLPEEFATYGTSVLIPHSDRIDSLNLSVAAGIGMYAFSTGREA